MQVSESTAAAAGDLRSGALVRAKGAERVASQDALRLCLGTRLARDPCHALRWCGRCKQGRARIWAVGIRNFKCWLNFF